MQLASIFYIVLLSVFSSNAHANIGATIANGLASKDHFILHKDIAYGAGKRQNLDIYTPKNISSPAPVIVFFYGGGWNKGEKFEYLFVADTLVDKGYTVVIPNYTLFPDAQFPTFVEDGAKAVKWVRDNIETYNGDPNRIAIMGHSAGAHIGGLLITDKHYLKEAGAKASDIKAFVGLAGPYGFTPKKKRYKRIFGQLDNYKVIQSNHFADGSESPTLLMHGADDGLVDKKNMEVLAKAINSKGGNARTKLYEGKDHVDMVAAFSVPKRDDLMVNDIDTFLKRVMQ